MLQLRYSLHPFEQLSFFPRVALRGPRARANLPERSLKPRLLLAGASPFRENLVRGWPMRELVLHVENHQIIVNLIDTRLTMTYQLSPDGQLEENECWTVDGGDTEFRQRAQQAAFSQARQLAWIPRLKSVA